MVFVVLIGNGHTKVTNALPAGGSTTLMNEHQWVAYVKTARGSEYTASQLISKVVFELHPTFPSPTVTVMKAPFEVKRLGWGVFNIPIKVYWKPWLKRKSPETFEHYLSFDGNGDAHSDVIEFDRKLDPNFNAGQ